jgi:outer membrane receptor protein involved in Fe transport
MSSELDVSRRERTRPRLSKLLGLLLSIVLLATTAFAQEAARSDPAPSATEDPRGADVEASSDSPAELDAPVEPPTRVMDAQAELIVVEGMKGQGIKEVPISVTQFGASDIQNLRIQNVADLSAYTPNLEINTSFAASNPTLFIRGVGLKDYNSNSAGAVGVWQDDVMMNSPMAQLFSIYDIESIQILRGPIGGLGGRNSTAGAIRINSFKPTDDWNGNGSFTYGNMNNILFEGAVGFPVLPELLDDKLSIRIAGITEFRDPYTKNVCSDWDPTEYGMLPSTEEETRAIYNDLEAHSTQVNTDDGTRSKPNFVYKNIDAVDAFNDEFVDNNGGLQTRVKVQTLINDLVDDDGNVLVDGAGAPLYPAGSRVGIQNEKFRVEPDAACLLDPAGSIQTYKQGKRSPPPNTWKPIGNRTQLADYQGLQTHYNDIKYWGIRTQVLYTPTDWIDFLANFHWGQNRSDAFHLQPVGAASAKITNTGEIIDEPRGYTQNQNFANWSEIKDTYEPYEAAGFKEGLSAAPGPGVTIGDPGKSGIDPYSGFYSSDGKENLDLLGGSLNGNFEMPWGRISSITGYEHAKRELEDEGDGCPCTILAGSYFDKAWQVTQELGTTYDGESYSIELGVFYIHEQLTSANIFQPSPNRGLDQFYAQVTDAFNIGFDVHYDFFEEDVAPGLFQISLDGGFRYNVEHKNFTLEARPSSDFTDDLKPPSIPQETVVETWHDPTGEITLSYKPVESSRIYFKYTHGFKAGHFNAGLTIQPVPGGGEEIQQSLEPVAPEYIDAVEVGLKWNLLDDRVELSGAFFRYWYQDLQVFDIVNEAGAIPTQQLLNADADVLGAELELTVRPWEGLLFQGSFGYNDSAFREFLVSKIVSPAPPQGGMPGESATFNYEGNSLIAAPRYSASGYTEYEWMLSRYGSFIPSFNFSYKSRTFLDPQGELLISQPSYWLLGARLAYRTPDGSIEIAAWVKNFLDQRYKTEAFDLSRQYRQINEIWAEPRTFGVTVSYFFSAD